jgi:hypothetical protein
MQIFDNANSCSDRNGMNFLNGEIAFWYYDGSAWSAIWWKVTTGEWNYVTWINRNGSLSLYVNWVRQSLSNSNLYSNCAGALLLGKNGYMWGSHYLDGALDEVRIYNRALTDSEVSALYNATK